MSELDEQIDVPQYLDEMSALQTRIREKCDPDRRANEPSLEDKAYNKAVSLAVPAIYEGVIDKLKENCWLAKTLAIEETAERNAAFAKRDYKEEELERSDLRKALVSAWQTNVRRWKQRKNYSRTVVRAGIRPCFALLYGGFGRWLLYRKIRESIFRFFFKFCY